MTLPKGAMTSTARWSKWGVWAYAVLAVLSGVAYFTDDHRWFRLIFALIWLVMAAVYYRSWRILQRSEVERE